MPTFICKTCGRPFEAISSRKRAYCDGPCFRAAEAAEARAHRARFSPERRRAHIRTTTAIENGTLTRQPCEICGVRHAVAHHDDYARPLDVRWLCRFHHMRWHRANGSGANAFIAEGH